MSIPNYVRREWVDGSAVDPALLQLNVEQLASDSAIETMLGQKIDSYGGQSQQYATGAVKRLLRRYEFLREGGWWASGLDPLNGWRAMEWGQFKPVSPRPNPHKPGQFVKYEAPPGVETRAYFFRVTWAVGLRIVQRCGDDSALLEYNDRMADAGEAPEFEDQGFWPWYLSTTLPLAITEGAKKTAALLTAGYACIGLPGVWNGFRSKDSKGNPIAAKLIADLSAINWRGRKVIVAYDQDRKRKTQRQVRKAIGAFSRLLTAEKAVVHVASWDAAIAKGADDLIVAAGVDALHTAMGGALPLPAWQTEAFRQLTYVPDRQLKLDNQIPYLGALNIPENRRLVALKAPKGAGKTYSLEEIVSAARDRQQPVLILTHRVQLGHDLCRRLGINYVSEIYSDPEGKLFGFGLCVDSLHSKSQARFDAEGWTDALVIIDEAEQVIWHLLNSETCIGKRVEILEQFKLLIENTLDKEGKGQVILADADLTDLSIQFIQKQAGWAIEPWIFSATKEGQPWEVSHFSQSNPATWFDALEFEILRKRRVLVHLSAQEIKSRWGTHNIELRLREQFPDKEILRIDAETVADPQHPAFGCMDKLNELLPKYDIVLASPVIETGVSIDVHGHFDSVWGCYGGVQTCDSVRQSLARLREPVPRFVWLAKHGLSRIGNGSPQPRQLLNSQQKMIGVNIKRLVAAGFDELDHQWNTGALETWACMAARVNAGQICYRHTILEGLRGEGHDLTEIRGESCKADLLAEEMAEIRDTAADLDRQQTCEAEQITESQAKKLKGSRSLTRTQRQQLTKHDIQESYLIDAEQVTPLIVERHQQGWHSALRRHYYLTVGREFLSQRDKDRITAIQKNGKVWAPDANRSQMGAQIALLELLGVLEWLKPNYLLSRDNEAVVNTIGRCYQHQGAIKTVLGVTIPISERDREKYEHGNPSMTPISIILKKLGLKMLCVEQSGPRDFRYRAYIIQQLNDGRAGVFDRWLAEDKKQTEMLAKSSSDPPQELSHNHSAVHSAPNNTYINSTAVHTDLNSPIEITWRNTAEAIGKWARSPFGVGKVFKCEWGKFWLKDADSGREWFAGISEIPRVWPELPPEQEVA
ncbi:MAG: plasmid replication protein, CyRepA1 family [Cyanobacteria bacterium J06635_1]